jgi:predicted RNase H-like HicB family nuclease
MQFTIIIESGATSYGAYVPDLPGCVTVGETREEARELTCEADVGASKAYANLA